jgi:phosphoglucosamine mutase
MRQMVLQSNADIGISLDGDGDRVILSDAQGCLVNGDQILYIIAQDRQQRGILHGGVVGTLMSNFGLEKAIRAMGVEFVRAQVGDRYVLETLKEKDWKIGGEPSGHLVCLDKTTTGDGIIAALQVLAIMVKQDKKLADLTQNITLFPQSLVNLKTEHAIQLAQDTRVLRAVDALDAALKNEGRVVLRPSGTEPVLRVMVEGMDRRQVQAYAEELSKEISTIQQYLF